MAESRTLGYNPPPDSTERTRLLRLKVNIDFFFLSSTGKSFSEALIFASTNPKYDDRFFVELQVQYMKIASWGEHVLF